MKKAILPFLLGLIFSPQLILAETCTWLGGNWNWNDPTKWSCGIVPDADDDVIISTSGNISSNTAIIVQSLSITHSGAVLNITGNLTLSGVLTWEAGEIKGSGNTIANGGVIFQGSATKTLADRSLTLNANSSWSDGMIIIPQALALTIAPGVTFEITGDDILRPQSGNTGILQNNGIILKSAGANTIFEVVNFTNDGNVNVTNGTLEFSGAVSDGNFNLTSPGVLQLYQNTLDLNAGATMSGTGNFMLGTASPTCHIHTSANITCPMEVIAGTVQLDENITLPALTTGTSSTIKFKGNGKLTVTGNVFWNGGSFENMPNGVRLEGNVTMDGSTKTIEECTLELVSNTKWKAGHIQLKTNGKLKNLGAFLDTLSTNQDIQQSPTNAIGTAFINDGTYITFFPDSLVATTIYVPFENNGGVQVNKGILQVEEGTSNAPITIATGGTFEKVGSNSTDFFLQSGLISGGGKLRVSGGKIHHETGAKVKTNVNIQNTGTISFTTFFPDTLTSLTMNGGSIETNASTTITIAGTFHCQSNNNNFSGGGTIKVNGGTTFSSSGNFSITDGTLELNSDTHWSNGNIKIQSNGGIINKPGKIFTVNLPTNRSINGAGMGQQFNNQGTIKKLTNSRLAFGANVAVTNTGLIQGLGIYDFKSTMQNAGTFAPGLSPGEMTLAGNIVNNNSLSFELFESGGTVTIDEMPIRGTFTLGGDLTISSTGNIPADVYTLIYCDSLPNCISGNFSQVNLPLNTTLEVLANQVNLVVSSPLPVELVDFYGKVESESNLLQWSTASENNTDEFVIERSRDGLQFEAIGSVGAVGISNEKQYYAFEDFTPYENSYYRLRILDFDDVEEFSATIFIKRPQVDLDAYPNPVVDQLYFKNLHDAPEYKIEILNTSGQRVFQSKGKTSINVANLPSGLLVLNIFHDKTGLVLTKKIIKN